MKTYIVQVSNPIPLEYEEMLIKAILKIKDIASPVDVLLKENDKSKVFIIDLDE